MAAIQPLGKINVSPAPVRSDDLTQYQINVESWARDVERTLRTYETVIRALISNLGNVTNGGGSPVGVIVAPVGSIYLRTNGGTSTTLYVKESGGDASGWVAK